MIRDAATQNQVLAADPNQNTWLSANAGSGKTKVLTDRVARLLLEDVPPQNILCLTYTKAAASEMQNRLFKRLGGWSMLSDTDLRADLENLGVDDKEGRIDLRKARRLFARAIETPGGLKIQTIHSFCAGLLRKFPLEAHVSPQFTELDEVSAEKLQLECLDDIAQSPQSDLLKEVLSYSSGTDLAELGNTIARSANLFRSPFDEQKLRETLGLPDTFTAQDILDAVFAPGTRGTIEKLTDVLTNGSANDRKIWARLKAIDLEVPNLQTVEQLEQIFLLGEKTKNPFGPKIGAVPTKPMQPLMGDALGDLDALMQRISDTRDLRLALGVFERTKAFHDFAHHFVMRFEDRKQMLGVLDFDDLIHKALELLKESVVADWVLFKLDGGIDHLLVDEAQDTSPIQWSVIQALTQDFATGSSARSNVNRTVFVVGDKKQSIYSFQGADPKEFDRMRAHFEKSLKDVGQHLQSPSLQHSFRSSRAILNVVDNTFVRERQNSIGGGDHHIAFKENLPGRVDLWPVIEPVAEPEQQPDWFEPVDQRSDEHHDVKLANRIADQIRRMVDEEYIPFVDENGNLKKRRVSEGDFLILVQRRKDLFSEIINACKNRDLNVAGADRLQLTAELAVKDITALLNFLALPEDSLSLAAALRSPLFGWSEKELYHLAHKREQDHLWPALRDSNEHPKTLSVLNDLRSKSDFLRPYELIERILIHHNGRDNLLSRLGMEAADAIDGLLSQALAYDSKSTPSLTGFLGWLESEATEIKRQIDSQSDEIRVMTVHGSKGLEAPIVILPETQIRRNDVKDQIIASGEMAFWKTPGTSQPKALTELIDAKKASQADERLRLLYVAMTRAENWLIVAGAGKVGAGDDSWYSVVAEGMVHSGATDAQAGELDIKRVSEGDWANLEIGEQEQPADTVQSRLVFGETPPVEMKTTLSPSDLGGAKALPDETFDEIEGKARGRVIHNLLETLPNVDLANRASVAHQLAEQHADSTSLDSDGIQQILSLVNDEELAWLFDKNSLAEVPFSAVLPNQSGNTLYGIVDRLIVEDDVITVVDYKSNSVVPRRPSEVPEGILRQMGAYAEGLKQIYPKHFIKTVVLWTETAELMDIPEELRTAALKRVMIP